MEKKTSPTDFQCTAVMESFPRETTREATGQKCGVSRSQLTRWRQEFQEKGPTLFSDKRTPTQKAVSQGDQPGESPDDLKKIIGEGTVPNEICKNVPGFLGNGNRLEIRGTGPSIESSPWPQKPRARSPARWKSAVPRALGPPNTHGMRNEIFN